MLFFNAQRVVIISFYGGRHQQFLDPFGAEPDHPPPPSQGRRASPGRGAHRPPRGPSAGARQGGRRPCRRVAAPRSPPRLHPRPLSLRRRPLGPRHAAAVPRRLTRCPPSPPGTAPYASSSVASSCRRRWYASQSAGLLVGAVASEYRWIRSVSWLRAWLSCSALAGVRPTSFTA